MKMKMMTSTVFIMLLVDILAFTFSALPCSVSAEDSPYFEVLDDIGTHFELPRFNVLLTTNTTVHMFLRACSSEMISYFIENASDGISSQLTLGYLKPFTTYYMYEDSYVNENAFTTDDIGSYTYAQDLSKLHHVFIQPRSGTIHISTSTTLHADINDDVAIIADNVVLDLNGYNIVGPGGWSGWMGIDVSYHRNVTIENGGIRNHITGIYLSDCRNIVIQNTTISSNLWSAVEMSGVWDSLITGNTFTSNIYALEVGWHSSGNEIYHNNFISGTSWSEVPYANTWDDGYPSGGNYWSGYTGVDLYNGPGQDVPGSDGIGDSPYAIDVNNIDHYPLMNSWTPTETFVKIGGKDEPVSIVSNTTIDNIVATKNNLKFSSSGPTGQNGYINSIFPMINTTDINVSIDGHKPASPFPIISTNGTHYFIYFKFTLSTHIVTIQFAPVTATIDIDPDTLNLKSEGEGITGYIELTEEYDINGIDVSTAMLNGTVPAELHPTEVGDHDGDSVPDLTVKFSRQTVIDYVLDHINLEELIEKRGVEITMTLTGTMIDGTLFQGSDTIKITFPTNYWKIVYLELGIV